MEYNGDRIWKRFIYCKICGKYKETYSKKGLICKECGNIHSISRKKNKIRLKFLDRVGLGKIDVTYSCFNDGEIKCSATKNRGIMIRERIIYVNKHYKKTMINVGKRMLKLENDWRKKRGLPLKTQL